MGNPNQQDLINTIMSAVYIGNGKAAEEAAQKINEEFILIRKSDLPPMVSKPQGWNNLDVMMARSAGYRGRNPKVYWERALDFISVALYAEAEVVKQEEREIAEKRAEAWKLLHPNEAHWDYEAQPAPSRKQIDVVVGLMNQVDELKATK